MGFKLTQRVIDLRGGLMTPAQKAALTAISRYADDETGGNSFPTLETIARKTEFNRRTILEAVNALIADGWISAVRTRYGRIFTVSISKVSENQEEESRCAGNSTSDVQEVTHVQDHARVQETASRCAGNCTSEVQEPAYRRDHLKEKEEIKCAPSAEVAPKAKKVRNSFVTASKPDDVPQALWDDFITHRRAKKAPVTETVITRTRSQAQKCGMTLAEALEMTVARGWQGFEARYVLNNSESQTRSPSYFRAHTGEVERNDDPPPPQFHAHLKKPEPPDQELIDAMRLFGKAAREGLNDEDPFL